MFRLPYAPETTSQTLPVIAISRKVKCEATPSEKSEEANISMEGRNNTSRPEERAATFIVLSKLSEETESSG